MSTIVPYVMHEAGQIPGIDGYFAAGQTVFVDVDEYRVVRIEQAGSLSADEEASNQEARSSDTGSPEAGTTINGG